MAQGRVPSPTCNFLTLSCLSILTSVSIFAVKIWWINLFKILQIFSVCNFILQSFLYTRKPNSRSYFLSFLESMRKHKMQNAIFFFQNLYVTRQTIHGNFYCYYFLYSSQSFYIYHIAHVYRSLTPYKCGTSKRVASVSDTYTVSNALRKQSR